LAFNRILLFTVVLNAAIQPGTESGIIVSINNDPVPFVSIVNERTGHWSVSDSEGHFWIPMGSVDGDSLYFERIGMKDQYFVYNESFLSIKLAKDPIHFPKITVQNKSDQFVLPSETATTRNEFLNLLPGSVLRSYGGNAGIAQVSVDGGRTADVKIIFNNIDLTSPQNGLTDLSQIPIQLLGRSSIKANQDLSQGSGTTDGVIHLNPWSHPTGIGIQSSDDNSKMFSLHYSIGNHNHKLNMVGGINSDPGTHPVYYNGELIQRENQYFSQKFMGIRHKFKFKSVWFSDVSCWNSIQDRGISGLIWSPNIEAFRNDTLSLLYGSLVRVFPKGYIKSKITYRRVGENYFDPTFRIDSDHISSSLSSRMTGYYSPNSYFTLQSNSGVAQEKVRSTDAGAHKRDRFFLATSIHITPLTKTDILTALRYDDYSDFGSALNYSFKVNQKILSNLTLSASMGSSFRVPTFNDLYWIPGGNPNLTPERSFFYSISGEIRYSTLSYKIYVKSNSSKDLIVWTSSGVFWKPENINESIRQIIGMKGKIKISDYLNIQSAMTFINSEDLSTGNPLRYSPKWIGNFSTQYHKWNWMLNLSLHMTGTQIIMYDFPSDLEMDPMLTSHLSISSPSIFHNRLNFRIHFTNLFNQEIMTIYGYPEPSRTVRLNISYQTNKKESQ
tara:strand:+ start:454 stop:2460 length:2007 start_codon:yes stop_codon:yes gene_type:complete